MTARPRRTTTLVGPNRLVLAAATGGLVALASVGTALLVMTGTSSVAHVAAPVPPLPTSSPFVRAPGVVMLPSDEAGRLAGSSSNTGRRPVRHPVSVRVPVKLPELAALPPVLAFTDVPALAAVPRVAPAPAVPVTPAWPGVTDAKDQDKLRKALERAKDDVGEHGEDGELHGGNAAQAEDRVKPAKSAKHAEHAKQGKPAGKKLGKHQGKHHGKHHGKHRSGHHGGP